MKYYLEQVKTDTNIPAKIYVDMEAEKRHYFLHFHDNIEFDLILEGTMSCTCNSIVKKITAGDFFFVNSGELHETSVGTKCRVKTITVLLSYEFIKTYCPDLKNYLFVIPPTGEIHEQIKNYITQIGKLYLEHKPYYEIEVTAILNYICLILLRDCKIRNTDLLNSSDQRSLSQIKAVLAYLEANYTEKISLSNAASQLNMVPSYFSRFFKKTTHESFYSYLMKLRSYHAYRELMNSDKMITEIALDNGFLNVKSFIDSFKKIYGETPAKYKKNHIVL